MFNLDAFTRHCRRAAAFGALAVGAIAFTSAAVASPLPLFPFILMPPIQAAPPPAQAAPSDDEGTVVEMPARLKRQVVSYATREAPGTSSSIPPTPIFIMCSVTAARCAMASASAAMALPGRAYSRSPRKTECRTGPRPGNDRTPALSAAPHAGGPGIRSALARCIRRHHLSDPRHHAPQTIGTQVRAGCIRLTNADVAISIRGSMSAPR